MDSLGEALTVAVSVTASQDKPDALLTDLLPAGLEVENFNLGDAKQWAGVVVAGVGVYAVTSYAVGTRTSEFGVRIALGARPRDVLRLVLAGGIPTILAGVAAGSLAAVAASRLLRNLLFGVEPLDPSSLAGGVALIAITAVAATLLPARRAARVDPLTALRD